MNARRGFRSCVEDVILHPVASDVSRSSGLPLAFGFTSDGQYMLAVFEQVDDVTVYPVTAYAVEE